MGQKDPSRRSDRSEPLDPTKIKDDEGDYLESTADSSNRDLSKRNFSNSIFSWKVKVVIVIAIIIAILAFIL